MQEMRNITQNTENAEFEEKHRTFKHTTQKIKTMRNISENKTVRTSQKLMEIKEITDNEENTEKYNRRKQKFKHMKSITENGWN